jgi:hypothetical protein
MSCYSGHDADFSAKLTIDTQADAKLRLGLFDLDSDKDLDDDDLVGEANISVSLIASVVIHISHTSLYLIIFQWHVHLSMK